MKRKKGRYANYVEHPRYGRGPRITGNNPQPDDLGHHFVHWNAHGESRIANTAVEANTAKQKEPTVPVTHYYDLQRCCVDCNRMFIFFAEEQRHWYEVLRFGLDADCVRCVPCRKTHRDAAYLRECYERLLGKPDRSDKETLELCDCALTLIERKDFGGRVLQRVRTWLNSIDSDATIRRHATFRDLTQRSDRLGEMV